MVRHKNFICYVLKLPCVWSKMHNTLRMKWMIQRTTLHAIAKRILNGCQFFNSILRFDVDANTKLQVACFKLIISKSINFKSITNSNRSYVAKASAAYWMIFYVRHLRIYFLWHGFSQCSMLLFYALCVILTQFKYNTNTDMVEMSIQWFIFCAFLNLLVRFFFSMSLPCTHYHSLQCYLRIHMQMNVSMLKVLKHFAVVNQQYLVPNMDWDIEKNSNWICEMNIAKMFGWCAI